MNSKTSITQEAARIICEEQLTDYRLAKQKAAQRLGLGTKSPMPDNADVQKAVVEYQQLFGGTAYRQQLHDMRLTAVKAMKLLAPFHPRLVGAVVTGAVTAAHRVQLHAFAEKPEALDIFLQDCKVQFEQGERTYRHARGAEQHIPLASFDAGGIGIDVAIFSEDDERAVLLNPLDGKPYKRLDLTAAEALCISSDR